MKKQSAEASIGRSGHMSGYEFVHAAFAMHPLIGDKPLSRDEIGILFDRTRRVLLKYVEQGLRVELFDAMVIALTVVTIAKKWMTEKEGGFWDFVFEQLRVPQSAKLYRLIVDCIDEGLSRNKKLFVFTRRHEYYATVMTHALSTKKSIFAYFDFLFEFYKNNLRFAFAQNDIAIPRLISILGTKLRKETPGTSIAYDKISSYFYKVQIGIQTLIRHTPVYATEFTENILTKLAAAWSGHSFEKETYTDELLSEWFSGKLSEINERTPTRKGGKARRLPISNLIDSIRPSYFLEEYEHPAICFPCTRLNRTDIVSPTLEITCGATIKSFALDCFGDEFGRSVEEKVVRLSDLARFESKSDLQIDARILNGDEVLHNFGHVLRRKAILFRGEKEMPLKDATPGNYLLFTSKDARVDCGDDWNEIGTLGQLLSVAFEPGFFVRVDDAVLCCDSERGKAQIFPKPARFARVIYKRDEETYAVFHVPPEIDVFLPTGHLRKRYAFMLNDAVLDAHSVSECDGPFSQFSVQFDASVLRQSNKFAIHDLQDDKNVCSLLFCVISDIALVFDAPYYLMGKPSGTARLTADGRTETFACGASEIETFAFRGGQLEVSAPCVSWRAVNCGAESLHGLIWHRDIGQHAQVLVRHPQSINVRLFINGRKIGGGYKNGESVFELGNHVYGFSDRNKDIAQIKLQIEATAVQKDYDLFRVLFRAKFMTPPEFVLKGKELRLSNPEAYAGPPNAELIYSFRRGNQRVNFRKPPHATVLSDDCNLTYGRYDITVFVEVPGIFSNGGTNIISQNKNYFLGNENEISNRHKHENDVGFNKKSIVSTNSPSENENKNRDKHRSAIGFNKKLTKPIDSSSENKSKNYDKLKYTAEFERKTVIHIDSIAFKQQKTYKYERVSLFIRRISIIRENYRPYDYEGIAYSMNPKTGKGKKFLYDEEGINPVQIRILSKNTLHICAKAGKPLILDRHKHCLLLKKEGFKYNPHRYVKPEYYVYRITNLLAPLKNKSGDTVFVQNRRIPEEQK